MLLQQAGSEGELCPPDSLGSADSSSTLASSVIEVETQREEPREKLQLGSDQQGEEEDEELGPPPTLSITEEILEFINQSRVMEGLSATNQNQDPPSEVQAAANPTRFSCPLPPVASSPERRLLPERDQKGEDLRKHIDVQDPDEGPDVPAEAERMAGVKGQEAAERGQGSDDEDEHALEVPPSSVLQVCISAEEEMDVLSDLQEAEPPQGPDLLHQSSQRFQLPKKGSTLTKKDQKIIEKIRSYYEAAAEAEEDDAEDEEQQREDVRRRRSSFSQIPAGLVKESVSRFAGSGHQGEVASALSTHEDLKATGESGSGSSSLPAGGEEPLRPPEVGPESPDQPTPTKENPESESRTCPEPEPEILEDLHRGSPEERFEEPEEGQNVDVKTIEEERCSPAERPENKEEERTNEPEPSQAEPSAHGPEREPGQTTEQTKTQPTWSRTKTGDQARPGQNLERFPSQSKVGRWSRHSRIVSANRALFEGMGSDVTGIGLFEANPVVDPVLIENSERILSKVQTLARMYSAKASTMKVPLHHKRASTIRTQAWVSARLSGNSSQNWDKSPSQQEKETGCGAQTGSETRTEPQACKQTSQNQTQTMVQEGSPEPQTDEPQEKGPWPCEPQLSGHVTRSGDQQNNGFSLSRPRDFICSLTKSSRTPGKAPSVQNQAMSARTQPEDQGSRRDGGCSELSDSPAVLVYSEPEEQQEAGGLHQDEGCCVYAAGGRRTSGSVSTQPADSCTPQSKASSGAEDADEPERDAAAGYVGHNEDKDVFETDGRVRSGSGSSTGLILTPPVSRTGWMSQPELSEEPPQIETWTDGGTGPVGSTGRQEMVDLLSMDPVNDKTTTKTFQDIQQDEAPSSPCSSDSLPTFTNQRPADLLAGVQRASSVPWTTSSTPERDHRKPDEPVSGSSLRTSSPVPSVFNPSLVHRSPSPLRSATTSSVRAPPCSLPFRTIPVSSPTPESPACFTSALSCLSPTPSSVSSVRTPTLSDPLCGNSSSSRGLPSSPTPPSTHLSPTRSSPSSSAFTRSLAASHISQSISQSMSKKGTARQQAPTIKLVNPSPSSTPDLRRRIPSPIPPTALPGTSTPAYTQLGCTKDGYQHPRCTPSSLQSTCLSPPSLSQCPPSPSAGLRQPHCSSSPSPRPSFLHSKSVSPQLGKKNTNNNNSAGYVGGDVSNGGCSGTDGGNEPHQSHYPLWSGSHNRVARPFSASEPSSRVQSPTPSPTPASFVRLCSPPLQHNYSSPMANKPPHPRSRVGGSHNHLDLRLDLPRASFDGSTFDDSSACVSPQILSPPPIGVPVWTNNVAAPQPRNPRHSTSPSLFLSTSGSQTYRSSSSTSGRSSLLGSSPPPSQTVRRPLSSTLTDRPSSPARSNGSGLRRSWADFSQRSLSFTGAVQGSFEQQESCPISPSSGWSSHSSSPSCLSPRTGLQSSLPPTRFIPGKGAISGQHFTSVPWPDVRELSSKYNGADSPETSVTPTASTSPVHLITSPGPTDCQADWGDPELEEGNCRTQLICAYVTRPSHQQTVSSSSCLIFSPSGLTSPTPESHQLHNLQLQRQPQATNTLPAPSVPSPTPLRSSPLSKQGNQKASYATTVNLQIAGSGRITSFSTAQVSLTQTLQGGAGPPRSQEQMARRVSINGLSPVPQRFNRP
ncbi:uncharacterized protein FYW61_001786 isoform 2-T2 [Anableps anableps]